MKKQFSKLKLFVLTHTAKLILSSITILLLLSTFSCNSQTNTQQKNANSPKENGSKDIDIQFVKGTEYIDGCGCYFSLNKSDYDQSNYHLVFNYNGTCAINLSGNDVVLSSNDSIETIYPEDEKEYFQNEKYELTIEYKEVKRTGDEVFLYKGVMSIYVKETDEIFKKEVIGECGC